MEKNTSITVRISERMKEQLETCALVNCTTVSEVVRNVLDDFFNWKQENKEE